MTVGNIPHHLSPPTLSRTNFRSAPGKLVLVGTESAGKSTIANLLAGRMTPTSGRGPGSMASTQPTTLPTNSRDRWGS